MVVLRYVIFASRWPRVRSTSIPTTSMCIDKNCSSFWQLKHSLQHSTVNENRSWMRVIYSSARITRIARSLSFIAVYATAQHVWAVPYAFGGRDVRREYVRLVKLGEYVKWSRCGGRLWAVWVYFRLNDRNRCRLSKRLFFRSEIVIIRIVIVHQRFLHLSYQVPILCRLFIQH